MHILSHCESESTRSKRPRTGKGLSFAVEMCNLQLKSGRHFILEQPSTSRAWSEHESVMKLRITEGVIETEFHQCMYGLTTVDWQGSAPAKKPTRVITSHPALAGALTRRCDGRLRHAQLVGKSACSRAAQYPHEMCRAILIATEVIKKGNEELVSYLTHCEETQEGSGEPLAMGESHGTPGGSCSL